MAIGSQKWLVCLRNHEKKISFRNNQRVRKLNQILIKTVLTPFETHQVFWDYFDKASAMGEKLDLFVVESGGIYRFSGG